MKKVLVLFSSLFLITGMIVMGMGCVSSATTGGSVNSNPSFNYFGTLQGKIMDAITGAAIGGDDLKVYLIYGTEKREPNKLIKDTNDDFVGEYAFKDVPVGLAAAGNNELNFKVVVLKDGYQRFETITAFTAVFVAGQSAGNWQVDNTFNNEQFNMIGDIYLYPLGSLAGDVTVYVRSPQGRPIENANVMLQQNIVNNGLVANAGFVLPLNAGGMTSSLTTTTDSDGKATFENAKLVLGGNYTVVVESMSFEGQQLRTTNSGPFLIGTNTTIRVVNMTAITNALVATSASNQVPGTVTADGSLTVTFNQPVLLDTTAFTVAVNGGSNGVLSSGTATAALSADNLTLTLSLPGWTTPPTTAGTNVTYAYGGNIFLKNSQTSVVSGFTLFGGGNPVVNTHTGAAVSGIVLMISN